MCVRWYVGILVKQSPLLCHFREPGVFTVVIMILGNVNDTISYFAVLNLLLK